MDHSFAPDYQIAQNKLYLMLCKNFCARRCQANQEQAKQALTPFIQLAFLDLVHSATVS